MIYYQPFVIKIDKMKLLHNIYDDLFQLSNTFDASIVQSNT